MKATIIGFDIKHYSGTEDIHEMSIKREVLRNTLQNCTSKYPEIKKGFNNICTPDTGDGCYIIIDSGNFINVIHFLEDINDFLKKQDDIRLRAAVHRGLVDKTKRINDKSETYIGEGINSCARNLNSEPLKTLIDINEDKKFVYGLSSEFYSEANESIEEINDKNKYDSFPFQEKLYTNTIYLNIYELKSIPQKKSFPEISITDSHKVFLKKTDFVYPDKSKPNDLSTFFIYPHLLFSKQLIKTMSKIDAKDLIHNYIENRGKILILGGDQTGKTTLAKKYFEEIFSSHKLLPIYINCTESVPRAYDNLIDENFKRQYGQKYSKEFKDNIVLIVDNFNLCKTSWQEEFIKKNSPNVIIFANSTFFDDLKKRTLLKDFSYYEIKTLGHEKRGELINKWIAFMDEEDKNYQVFDDLNQFVNQTLLSGLIPYTPFYVLTILLAKKNYTDNPNDKITSKARCYEMLVDLQLKYININDQEIPNYRTVFSYIAYKLYEGQKEYFSKDELKQVIVDYKEEYTLNGSPDELITIFDKSTIFCFNVGLGQYEFSYEYSYYYFLGKYIADNYTENENIKKIALSFLKVLYEKEKYYISVFIIHHLKNESYFNEICSIADILYRDYSEAKLTKDEFAKLDEEYYQSENIIINNTDNSKQKRLEEAREKDKYDDVRKDEDFSLIEATKEIQQTIRIVELLGQIVKNNGQLKKDKLTHYYTVGMNTYKRVCSYFLSSFKNYKNEFIELIKENIEKQGTLSVGDSKKQAYKMFAQMNFMSAYATVYRISDALSANHLISELIKPIVDHDINPMNLCIYIHGLMWYRKELPFDNLKKTYHGLPKEVQFLIQAFLQDYSEKHHLKMKDKQKLASTFDIPLKQLDYDTSK